MQATIETTTFTDIRLILKSDPGRALINDLEIMGDRSILRFKLTREEALSLARQIETACSSLGFMPSPVIHNDGPSDLKINTLCMWKEAGNLTRWHP
jgi:hypothetical protein